MSTAEATPVPAESINIWTRKHAIAMPVWHSTAALPHREQIGHANVTTPIDVCALPKVSTLPRMTTCIQSPIGWL
jgi:hypothetical protein